MIKGAWFDYGLGGLLKSSNVSRYFLHMIDLIQLVAAPLEEYQMDTLLLKPECDL